MHRLRIPVEYIDFEQWADIFNALREEDYFGYVIVKNNEDLLAKEFNYDIMGLLSLVSNSPNYDVKDEYILYDKHHNLLLSGFIHSFQVCLRDFYERIK